MFKMLVTIPDTFDPDDRRRRQILNILLMFFVFFGGINFFISLGNLGDTYLSVLLWGALAFIVMSVALLFINRSRLLPGWVGSVIFIGFLMVLIALSDSSEELYDGRSLIAWVLPIMIGAVIFRPAAAFLIAALIAGLMEFFSYYIIHIDVNYYAMANLFVIAFISWLGMSIANRAIRDARRHAANNEAILKNIADGVLVLDLQGDFLSANPALLCMIPESEIKQLILKPFAKNFRWKHKVFSVSVSDVPEIGTVAVFRDETRRYETERARDALLATASHELRTPLTAVMNYLEFIQVLIKIGKVNTDEFNQHVARALENVKRLHSLVNDILDQAQIQAGVFSLKNDIFNLRLLLEKAHQLLSILIEEKKLSYELKIASDVPAEITGDSNRLHQVLVNLLGNAIKFTNEGGIEVTVSMLLKDRLSIQVTDSGPGIPPEQLPDIFEAFRRGSNYIQRERQGAGLGLSIVKELISRMGGEISVSSEPGRGATFTILLPIEAV